MSRAPSTPVSVEARTELLSRLLSRRAELEQAVLGRVNSISHLSDTVDPIYAEGLLAATRDAVTYGLSAIARWERPEPVPVSLLAQARLAARNGIGVDVVVRRYLAGHAVLSDFILEEAGGLLREPELRDLFRVQLALLDALLAQISEEHAREAGTRLRTSGARRAEGVRQLLTGESSLGRVLSLEAGYDFDIWHIGIVAAGPEAPQWLREALTGQLGRVLFAQPYDNTAWAWLGSRQPSDPDVVTSHLASDPASSVRIAVGEPAHGIDGWRLTHRQAAAAMRIALRGATGSVRYADVTLLASALSDDLVATSLTQIYLTPLADGRGEDGALRNTLRAYFAAGSNATSTAASLGVSRQTVGNRLRTIEGRLDRRIADCAAELIVALKLEELAELGSTGLNIGKP